MNDSVSEDEQLARWGIQKSAGGLNFVITPGSSSKNA